MSREGVAVERQQPEAASDLRNHTGDRGTARTREVNDYPHLGRSGWYQRAAENVAICQA